MSDIYIDLLTTNSIQTSANNRVQVSFFQNFSQPILKNTTGYKFSIVRFVLNTENLPVFIPSISNTTNNQTIYSITMEYNGIYSQTYMTWIPQNSNPIDSDEYYYCYNYQYLAYLVTLTFAQCLAQLNDVVNQHIQNTSSSFTNTNVPNGIVLDPPTMTYNVATQLFSINFNSAFNVNVYFNLPMQALFPNLTYIVNNNNLNNGSDYQLNLGIFSNTGIMTQEIPSIGILNPISSIFFTSNLIPIEKTISPTIQIYSEGQLVQNNSSYSFVNQITDFIGDNLSFSPFVQYSPTIYRYVNLIPGTSIQNIDLQVFYQNKNTGLIKTLYLAPGGSSSVKILITNSC